MESLQEENLHLLEQLQVLTDRLRVATDAQSIAEQALKSFKQNTMDQISSLRVVAKEATEQLTSLQSVIDDKDKALFDLSRRYEVDVNQTRAHAESAEHRCRELEAVINHLENSLDESERHSESEAVLRAKLTAAEDKITILQRYNERMQASTENIRAEVEVSFRERIKETEAERDKTAETLRHVSELLEKATGRLVASQEKVDALTVANQALETANRESDMRILDLEKQLDSTQRQLHESTQDLAKFKHQVTMAALKQEQQSITGTFSPRSVAQAQTGFAGRFGTANANNSTAFAGLSRPGTQVHDRLLSAPPTARGPGSIYAGQDFPPASPSFSVINHGHAPHSPARSQLPLADSMAAEQQAGMREQLLHARDMLRRAREEYTRAVEQLQAEQTQRRQAEADLAAASEYVQQLEGQLHDQSRALNEERDHFAKETDRTRASVAEQVAAQVADFRLGLAALEGKLNISEQRCNRAEATLEDLRAGLRDATHELQMHKATEPGRRALIDRAGRESTLTGALGRERSPPSSPKSVTGAGMQTTRKLLSAAAGGATGAGTTLNAATLRPGSSLTLTGRTPPPDSHFLAATSTTPSADGKLKELVSRAGTLEQRLLELESSAFSLGKKVREFQGQVQREVGQ